MVDGGQAPAKPGESRGPDPLIGRVIADRFKIVSLIARGGMGKVYRAEQSPLGRMCAIKVLNPNYNGDADPEFHRRFYREASITSKITHPNSVTIFDYGKTDDDIFFMAMEYLEGQTLHMALRDAGVMAEHRVGRIATQICRAVREAHKLGVIHRDLKPANIFLIRTARSADTSDPMGPASEEEEDFVKVLDFGLVKHLAERPEEQLTQTGLFMGSPKYMAPEQIQGGHVDERTDIYSLGIMMYEMLAGKVPFERATSVNILMAHVGEPPPPMREVNPRLVCSPAFEELVMCCIAKDPKGRYASMDQVLAAIRRAHGGSMTGQIAAVASGNWVSGPSPHTPPPGAPAVRVPYPSYASAPAPPNTQPLSGQSLAAVERGRNVADVSGGHEHRAPGVFNSATGSHSQLMRVAPSNDHGPGPPLPFEERPRSKSFIVFGVVMAAVVGGGLGMVIFDMTAPPLPSRAAASASVSAGPRASSVVPMASTDKPEVVKLTTEPAGATVREDAKELCAATPCDVVFKDDGGKAHKITITHPGFKTETRTVKAGEPPLLVKLVRTSVPASSSPKP